MITIRRSQERGRSQLSWLDSRHSFSFADYYEPRHMGYRSLRVINEDRVAPGAGFPEHAHRDMEIVTYVLAGALEHRDSLGTRSVIRPGEVQRMSAGTGIMHSELNASATEPVHFLQIWLRPDHMGLAPSCAQRAFPESRRRGRLCLVASRDGRDDSITLHQDVRIHATLLAPGESVEAALAPSRHAWVQVTRGQVTLNGQLMGEGDGAALASEPAVRLASEVECEVLLFDLA